MISKVRILLIIIIIAGGAALATLALSLYSTSCSLGNAPPTIHYTIIESSSGYNDSKDHYPNAWPIMTVHCGQIVSIHIQNIDTSEAHGFMMDKYFVSEIVLQPGTSTDLSFTASQAGTFTFRCTIPCVVHQYMLNGKVIVTG